MKIHHLNCATTCPFAQSITTGVPELICHCLLLETEDGLTLVDGGLGTEDVHHPEQRLTGWFRHLVRPKLDIQETALFQIKKLGFDPNDVRHILPTHMDLDHIGALSDFPKAKIHILEKEYDAAMARATLKEQQRYCPPQWAHNPIWEKHKVEGERWFGFEAVKQVGGLPPDVLIIPLYGHTRGHAAIAIQSEGKWLVHAGDGYFHHGEVHPEHPHCPVGFRVFETLMQMDGDARVRNVERLRQLIKSKPSEVDVFCSHDPADLKRFTK